MSALDDVFADIEKEEDEKDEKPKTTEKEKPSEVEVVEEEISESTDNELDDLFGEAERDPPKKEESKTKTKPEKSKGTPAEPKEGELVEDWLGEEKKSPISHENSATEEFDLSEEEPTGFISHMWYGLKGGGKTGGALSYPGKIAALSFDRKTTKVKFSMYDGDKRIRVFDGIRYLDKDDAETWLESANKSYRYILKLLDGPIRKMKPDWILIDGTEIFIREICEMTMRARENLQAFQGVDFKLWEERNMFVDHIHNRCLKIAKRGIIYTAYVKETTSKIERGVIIEKAYAPKWAANIKTQVDTVIFVESLQNEDVREFWATVESSKNPDIVTGLKVDITNSGISTIWEESKKRLKKKKKKKE